MSSNLSPSYQPLKKKTPNLLNLKKLKTSLDLIQLVTDESPIEMINYYLLSLLEMIFRLPEIPTKNDTTSLIQSLRQLGPSRLENLLLLAFKKLDSFKALALVRVLLEAGANANVIIDELHGNTSLHVAAGLSDRKLGDAVGRLLIEFGAKLHQVNKAGKTALDIWIELNEMEVDRDDEAGRWSGRPEWCLPVQTLQCLAARVIRVNKLPYVDGTTPATLHSLIELR